MEIAVAAVAARDHELLMNYFLIIIMIPYSIICLVATCLAIELYLMLIDGLFSVIVMVVNVQLCVLTGVEPGTGLDGMYICYSRHHYSSNCDDHTFIAVHS